MTEEEPTYRPSATRLARDVTCEVCRKDGAASSLATDITELVLTKDIPAVKFVTDVRLADLVIVVLGAASLAAIKAAVIKPAPNGKAIDYSIEIEIAPAANVIDWPAVSVTEPPDKSP